MCLDDARSAAGTVPPADRLAYAPPDDGVKRLALALIAYRDWKRNALAETPAKTANMRVRSEYLIA